MPAGLRAVLPGALPAAPGAGRPRAALTGRCWFGYFVREIVQVAVAVELTLSGPTQAAGNVIAIEPEIDDVVAARVPVPENEHPGVTPDCAGTLKVADVSCAPDTVPVRVVLTFPSPASTTSGPETLAPLWAAVQDLIGVGRESLGLLKVPIHVPARLIAVGGVVVTVEGEVGESPLPHAAVKAAASVSARAIE